MLGGLDRAPDVSFHVAVDATEHRGRSLERVVIARRAALGGLHPAIELLEPARVDRQPRSGQGQPGVVEHGLARQCLEPVGDRVEPAVLKELGPVVGDQLNRVVDVVGRDRVADRLRHEAAFAVPAAGAMVKLGGELGLGPLQLVP